MIGQKAGSGCVSEGVYVSILAPVCGLQWPGRCLERWQRYIFPTMQSINSQAVGQVQGTNYPIRADELPAPGRPDPPGPPWGPALSLPLINFSCSLPLSRRSEEQPRVVGNSVGCLWDDRMPQGWMSRGHTAPCPCSPLSLFLKSLSTSSAVTPPCNSFVLLFLISPLPDSSSKIYSLHLTSVLWPHFSQILLPSFSLSLFTRDSSYLPSICLYTHLFLPHFSSISYPLGFPSCSHRLKSL